MKILIKGEKVQGVGYRLFLLRKAYENDIKYICARNIDTNRVEVLVKDEEYKVNTFYEMLKKEKPEEATVKDVKREPYNDKIPIPPVDRFFHIFTCEQLYDGRELVAKLPDQIGEKVGEHIKGIGEKLDNLPEKIAEALTKEKTKLRKRS